MTDALTVEEAVPLGTVHVQRLLGAAGIRSLAIKGPSFLALGVRQKPQSRDIDLLVHLRDRQTAATALDSAGWTNITGIVPRQLEDITYSVTYRHQVFPVTVDLHHGFPGVFAGPAAFDTLWEQRSTVTVAHQAVDTLSQPHALVLEALNAMKRMPPETWTVACRGVLSQSIDLNVDSVVEAAEDMGARHPVAPLTRLMGGPEPAGPAPRGYHDWAGAHRRSVRRDRTVRMLRRAPQLVPRLIWQRIALDEDIARFWTDTQEIRYRSRWQVFGLRLARAARRLRDGHGR